MNDPLYPVSVLGPDQWDDHADLCAGPGCLGPVFLFYINSSLIRTPAGWVILSTFVPTFKDSKISNVRCLVMCRVTQLNVDA